MYRYCIAGLSVASDIEIPGLFPDQEGAAPPDVTIRFGVVPRTLDGATATGPTWAMANRRFLLRVPGIVGFLLEGGNSVTYQTEPGAEPGDAAAFLIGTGFGILLHQREQFVLHASGVAVKGKAVLFLGPSGAGKSTLAAALGQRGYPLVTDDFCVVRLEGGVPQVYPDGRLPKLWAQAIERLELTGRRGQPVRGKLQKFYVEPPQEASAAPLPIGAVYVLREARAPLSPGIERPNIVDAALLLRSNAYRARLVAQMDQKAAYFQLAAVTGNHAGIFFLTRELRFGAMAEVIAGLERHWEATEILAGAA